MTVDTIERQENIWFTDEVTDALLKQWLKKDDMTVSKHSVQQKEIWPDNPLKEFVSRSTALKKWEEIRFMIDFWLICMRRNDDINNFKEDKQYLELIYQELKNNKNIDLNYIEKSLSSREDNSYKNYIFEKIKYDHIRTHPGNDGLRNGDAKKQALFENNKTLLEEYWNKIRETMSADTWFWFLREHRNINDIRQAPVTEFDISDMERAKLVFDTIIETLKEYNNLFGGKLKIKNLYVTSYEGETYSGLYVWEQSSNTQSVILNIWKNNTPYTIKRIIHHELLHALDDGTDEDDWSRDKLWAINLDAHTGEHGWKEVYGSKNSHESKAVLWEQLMTDPAKALQEAREDLSWSIKKKIEVMTWCKISEDGFYFIETYTEKSYPDQYKKLWFSPQSYYLGRSDWAMDAKRWNMKMWFWSVENISSFWQDDTYIVYDIDKSPKTIFVGNYSLSLKNIGLSWKGTYEYVNGVRISSEIISSRKLANYINNIYEEYIIPLKWGTKDGVKPFELDDHDNIVFYSDKKLFAKKTLLKEWSSIWIDAKNSIRGKRSLVFFLNSLYKDANF